MNWNTRLTEARENRGIGKSELARLVGVSPATLTNWENGKVESIKGENLMRVAAALNVSESWLMHGDEHDLQRLLPGAQRVTVLGDDDEHPDHVRIPLVKLRLSAGITGFQTDPEFGDTSSVHRPLRWLEVNNYAPDRLIAVRVKGQSMEPTLYEDDTVIINTADKKLVDGVVYAFNYEGEAVIKRLSRDAGQWWLMSDNPDQRKYHRKHCHGDDCIVIGRVVHRESSRI